MAKQGKERIIAAAFQLFLEKGYKGVSLKDITTATDLSKGAVYHHFDSKYAIYLAAIEEYFFNVLQARFPQDENLDFKKRLRQRYGYFVNVIEFIEQMGATGISFPIRAYFIFQLESEQDDFILERVQRSMDNYRQEIVNLIQTAIDRQEIDTSLSARLIAQHIMSMMEGIAIHHSSIEKNCKAFLMDKYDEVIDSYLDLLITKRQKVF